ncbi:MAG: rRNA pseudouridine synthase [Candidatus Omnitrophica bacterium]|nr:rRNA pseudouridine synthase [Candidatus Omnitrophota bacterium]
MRLQVVLSHNGVCSRREAMGVIQSGRVTLNGAVNKEPSTPVDPRKDKVTVDGRKLEIKSFDYIMLHKPAGFVTTKEDAHAERTVMDLLPENLKHVVPVGRLDKDTEGLLLLTNDGDLTFRLTHPQFQVDKTYVVRIGGPLLTEKKNKLQDGVVIEGHKTAPAQILDVKAADGETEFLMVIHEGKKRQVRLMMKAVGCSVRYLKRISQGTLQLGKLALGQWRELTASEVASLKTKNAPRKPVAAPQPSKRPPFRPMEKIKKPIDKRTEHERQTQGFSPREKSAQKPNRKFNNHRRPKQ